jgi:hypothetical protein
MKARIKKTGEIVNISEYARIALDQCDSWGCTVEVKPEDVELIQEKTEDEHWQEVRERAADKSKADKTLIRRPFKLLAGHRYFCIKTPVWTDHYYQVGKMYESINDDKIVDDLGKEHTFSDKIDCPPQHWFCEVAEPVQEINVGPKPQPSKEWSEGDKNRFNNLIFLVEHSDENEATKEGFIKFINKLKSLRPQNQWKPNDKQMSALKEQCVYKKSTVAGEVLCELYHDLEKLKEE